MPENLLSPQRFQKAPVSLFQIWRETAGLYYLFMEISIVIYGNVCYYIW